MNINKAQKQHIVLAHLPETQCLSVFPSNAPLQAFPELELTPLSSPSPFDDFNPLPSNFPFESKPLTFLTFHFTSCLKLKTLTPLSSPKIKTPEETLIDQTGTLHSITAHLINFSISPSPSSISFTAKTQTFLLETECSTKKLIDPTIFIETPWFISSKTPSFESKARPF
jgi:hypothetical protein